jgi:HK97 family phage major capsid protein
MKTLLDSADFEKRNLKNDEVTGFEEGEKLLDALADELEKRPNAKSSETLARIFDGQQRYGEGDHRAIPVRGGVNLSYRELFYGRKNAALQDTRDVESFFQKVTEIRGAMLSGVGEKGGAFIPETFISQTFDATLALAGLLSFVTIYPVPEGNALTIGLWNNQDHSDGQHFGGVAVQWRAEGAAFSAVTPKARNVQYSLYKMGMFIDVSREMIEGFDGEFAPILSEKMQYALNAETEAKILNGAGAGEPVGVMNDDCTIPVTRNAANTVAYVDLASMMGRLHPALHQDAIWIANQEVLPQLMKLQDPAGGYVWIANAGVPADSRLPGTLFGKPLLISEQCAALGSEGDILLGNFRMYGLALKKEVQFESTNAHRWLEDMLSYRAIFRCDGHPLLDGPITPANGTNTVSAFVKLN